MSRASLVLGASMVLVLVACASGQSVGGDDAEGTGGSDAAGSGTAGSGTAGAETAGAAGKGTAGTGTAGSGTAGTSTAGNGTAGTGTAGSGTAGTGTAGTGTAGSGTAGSGTAGSATAGTGTAGSGTAGTSTAGNGTAGTGTAGSGTAGTGTSGSGTAGTGTSGSGTAGTGTAGSGTAGTGTSGSGTAGTGTAGTGTAGSGGSTTSCPLPSDACTDGTQNRRGCVNGRVISRKTAAAGFTKSDDTCSASDDEDNGSGCFDAGADHTYRVWVFAGEQLSASLNSGFRCFDSTFYDATLKIYGPQGAACDAPTQKCQANQNTSKLVCEDYVGTKTYAVTASVDGWYSIIVDGSTAFDDEGDYTVKINLTCAAAGCGCP